MSFPTSPSDGQQYTASNGAVFQYDSSTDSWTKISTAVQIQRPGKNKIQNGDMSIAQRGTSFTSVANGDYTLDRYLYQKVGVMTHTITQDSSTPSDDFGYSLKLDCTAVDTSIATTDFCVISQRIEGYNFRPLAGKNCTLSFWVKAGKTGTMCVAFQNSGNNRTYVVEVPITAASTWQYKQIPITFDDLGGTWDYTNGIGIKVLFCLVCGTAYHTTTPETWITTNDFATFNQTNFVSNNDTTCDVWLTGIQLEEGTQATDFEFRSFQEELKLCERYYEKSYEYGDPPGTTGSYPYPGALASYSINNNNLAFQIQFKTRKRTAPTATAYSPQTGTSGKARYSGGSDVDVTNINNGEANTHFYGAGGAASTQHYLHYVAEAKL